jgi:hypothetical protein
MTGHSRKYGDRPSHPIYVWNGLLEPKHRKKIDSAIWEFLWCLDRITKEKDGIGIVLGGRPVTYSEVATCFEVSVDSVRRHMDRLELYGYIERTLAPYGYVIRVLNSCKFRNQVRQKCDTSSQRGTAEVHDLGVQKCHTWGGRTAIPNKSKQLNEAVGVSSAPQNLLLNPKPVKVDRWGLRLADQGGA